MTYRFAFVLEQTLGNAVHGRNLVRAAEAAPDVLPTVLPVRYDEASRRRRAPLVGNWTVDASVQARRAVVRHLRQSPVDVLFVHTQTCAQLLGDLMRRVPTVLSTDATPMAFDSVGGSYGHRTRTAGTERLKQAVSRVPFQRAAAVTTWSRWAAESVVRDYGVPEERVQPIHPGVQVGAFRPGPPRPPGGPLRVLFVGGDFERKGGPELVEAVTRLGPAVELDIVTSRTPDGLPPNVRVHLGLGHGSTELFALYQQADVFALPTRGDTLGLVYAEAMASGLPVVGCDVGGVGELVVQGQNGLLVPPGRPEPLVEALRALGADPELRTRMGERGLRMAREQHDAERNCAAILDLMRSVADAAVAHAGARQS